MSAPALLAALAGLVLGLGLIVAIGAQNAFVLRQGLRAEHVGPVVAVCAASDLALMTAGVLGAGAALTRVSWLLPVVRIAGAAFLLSYGVLAARRALRPGSLTPSSGATPAGLAVTLGTCLALTWLNPHVYLDTVLLVGTTASSFGAHRWDFAAGAGVASVLWFTALGFGARLLRPLFGRRRAWRVLDGLIAVVMLALGGSLLLLQGVSA